METVEKELEVRMANVHTASVSQIALTADQQKHLEALEWIIDPGNYKQRLLLTTIAHLRKVCRKGSSEIRGTLPWLRAIVPLTKHLLKTWRGGDLVSVSTPSPGVVHVGWSKKLEDLTGDERYRLGQLREELLLRPFATMSPAEAEMLVTKAVPPEYLQNANPALSEEAREKVREEARRVDGVNKTPRTSPPASEPAVPVLAASAPLYIRNVVSRARPAGIHHYFSGGKIPLFNSGEYDLIGELPVGHMIELMKSVKNVWGHALPQGMFLQSYPTLRGELWVLHYDGRQSMYREIPIEDMKRAKYIKERNSEK
jgi:hypothetical protein